MRDVSNYRARLAPGSIPAHADPCDDYINIGMPSKALPVRLTYATAAGSMPSHICSVTDRSPLSLAAVMLLPVVALARATQATARTAMKLQGQLKRADIEIVILAGSSLFLSKWRALSASHVACVHV